MPGGSASFTLDGTRYDVSASAMLDYMPHSWVTVRGHRYTFAAPPFPLMKGG